MRIIISGTPGTGKSYLAKKLAKLTYSRVLEVNELIKKKKLHQGYDRSRRCYIVDEHKLSLYLAKYIRKCSDNIIIVGHMAHYISPKLVDLCIITKANLKTLRRRLMSRNYVKSKIRENLDAEIFDVCYNEAKELGHKVITYDSTRDDFRKTLKNFVK